MDAFERVFIEAAARVRLNGLRCQLTHEEVLIAIQYLEKLIDSRPKSPAVAKVVPIRKECPDALLPDGDICPRCGGPRAPSGVDGGSWVHFPRRSPSEILQDELEPLPNENLKYAV